MSLDFILVFVKEKFIGNFWVWLRFYFRDLKIIIVVNVLNYNRKGGYIIKLCEFF